MLPWFGFDENLIKNVVMNNMMQICMFLPSKLLISKLLRFVRCAFLLASLSFLVMAASIGAVNAQQSFSQQRAMVELDKVLVIINEDVITQTEFDYRKRTVISDMQNAERPLPPNLDKQLLDSMISDRLQVQEAKRRGITISDEELAQTIERFASQQNLSSAQLKASIEQSGQPFSLFESTVRDSLTISRFSEYYARSRVVVPDYEIDGWLAANNLDQENVEYEIAQILIKGGDEKRQLAEQVRSEIEAGLSFQNAAIRYSDAVDAAEGGVIGWRKPAQMPEIFVTAVKDLQAGEVSQVVQSPNGFHILNLINVKGERAEILQNSVRHILISAESKVAKAQATKRAVELRQRIIDGEDFEALARIYSDDSVSAAAGGSLGWVSPGEMVAPFEDTFISLPIGQVSQPVETRFGVHILRVEDRRKKNVSEQMKRARADSILRRQRADREYGQWVRELLEGAYVKHVAKPA